MKKFLALALILTLALALSISSFAYFVVGGVDGVLTGNVTDGAEEIETGTGLNDTQISVNVTAQNISHRYAVDIDVSPMAFNIAGSEMVWDVNTLQYVAVAGGIVSAPAAQTITITNRSDLPVILTPKVNPTSALSADDCPMTLIVDEPKEIAAATPGNAFTTTVTVTPGLKQGVTSWDAVATYFAPYLGTAVDGSSEYQIATIDLSITAKP